MRVAVRPEGAIYIRREDVRTVKVVRVIEDDPDMRELEIFLLRDLGYRTPPSVEPDALMDRRHWSGCMVTHAMADLKLRGWPFDGIDLLQWLVDNEPGIVRIVCSGSLDERTDAIALETANLAHFAIGKPPSPRVLQKLIG